MDPSMALKEFEPDFYDLAILDIKMPDKNGFELYDRIKSKDPKIKTLFLTALDAYNDQRDKVYPNMGERHFLKKPISNHDLWGEFIQ